MISIENNLDNVKINSYDLFMVREKYHHGNLKQSLIDSGILILQEDGISALTLRSAARRAGVSHSAPYAHFTDKGALLAAISTQGFLMLDRQLSQAVEEHHDSPANLLVEFSWAYTRFALEYTALFKLMFSGILEDEHAYPEFMTAVRKTYNKLIEVVKRCQSAGVLQNHPAEDTAIAIWSMVHGFVNLYIERQIPGQLVEGIHLKDMLVNLLTHLTTKTKVTL